MTFVDCCRGHVVSICPYDERVKVNLMKTLMTAVVLLTLCPLITFSSGELNDPTLIYSFEGVEIKVLNEASLENFVSFNYKLKSKVVHFETVEDIKFIQIFDIDGMLLFQVPVSSKKLQLGEDLLESGNFKIGFTFSETEEVHFIHLKLNQ